MEASSKASFIFCKNSVGLGIKLPREKNLNEYITDGMIFKNFFTRKFIMNFSSKIYIFMPGGLGTMDEFFEILTLIANKKIEKVPVILVGKEFWNPIVKYMEKTLYEKFQTISKSDLNLFKVLDDEKEILKILKKTSKKL